VFRVVVVDDYHEIVPPKGWRAIELGCFPAKGASYGRYFGLYYKEKRPAIASVITSVLRKVEFGEVIHYRTGEDISMTKEEVVGEVKESLE
jgi:hypothetical protein